MFLSKNRCNLSTFYKVSKVVLKSLFLSMFLYYVYSTSSTERSISMLSRDFDSLTRVIELNKQKILMMAMLAESETELPVMTVHENVSSYDVFTYTDNDGYVASHSDNIIADLMKISQKYIPSLFSSDEVFMYYRSYLGGSIISGEDLPNFPASSNILSKERCLLHESCSIYSKDYQLRDRLIISPIYDDLYTGRPTISIVSPVYNEGKIIGDFVVDVHLPDSFVQSKSMLTYRAGSYKNNVLEDINYPFKNFAYSKEYVADNRSKFILRLSFIRVFLHNCWLFGVIFLLISLIVWKWEESKLRHLKLQQAMIAANRDELTSLYNRKIFKDEAFLNEVAEKGASVIVIDGNRLKEINDTHGHAVGDLAIQHIANGMKKTFRSSDFLIRSGGDEFVVVLPGCQLQRANVLAENLKNLIADNVINPYQVSVSISTGVVEKRDSESIKSALLRADEQLYEEKGQRKGEGGAGFKSVRVHGTLDANS